ncbi:MAG: hypothetical protein ACFE0S_00385 [Rhodospirillales bacterium]
MKQQPIIVVEMPRSTDKPKLWVAEKGVDDLLEHVRSEFADNAFVYEDYTLEEIRLESNFNGEIPAEAVEIAKNYGKVFHIIGPFDDVDVENFWALGWYDPECAPDPIAWAKEVMSRKLDDVLTARNVEEMTLLFADLMASNDDMRMASDLKAAWKKVSPVWDKPGEPQSENQAPLAI